MVGQRLMILACLMAIGCQGRSAAPEDVEEGRFQDGVLSAPLPLELLDPFAREPWNPQFFRSSETALNGGWQFRFDAQDEGLDNGLHTAAGASEYDQTIEVPFPWQSVLSGVGPALPDEYQPFGSEAAFPDTNGVAWYGREVVVPADFPLDQDWVLRFGAIDWSATVYINGTEVLHHVGGYDPVEVVVPEAHKNPAFRVAVRVFDACYDTAIVGGKQGGLWYRCAAGLWQEPTLYHRPMAHVVSVQPKSIATSGVVDFEVGLAEVESEGILRLAVGCEEEDCPEPLNLLPVPVSPGTESVAVSVDLSGFPLWTPDRPRLLRQTIQLCVDGACDTVHGYTARYRWSTDWVAGHGPDAAEVQDQFKGLLLNGEPFAVRGVLDQGYHPEGIYQYPSKAARAEDLNRARLLGFNTIRQHIKPEPPWFYAMCDRMGLAVIYDMPSPYDTAPSGGNAPWRKAWKAMVEALVVRDAGHPSIMFWVNFNEAWGLLTPPFWQQSEGLAFVAEMAQWVRQLDPTRPVEDHSPGGFSEFLDNGALPHVDTDINSFHIYDRSVTSFAERFAAHVGSVYPGSTANFFGALPQAGQPLVVSEFGGLSADDTRGDAIYPLHGQLNVLRAAHKNQGFVYTQLYDVEWERNGLWTYDRRQKETGLEALGLSLADLLGPDYLVLGTEPAVLGSTSEPITVPCSVRTAEVGSVQEVAWQLLDSMDAEVAAGTIPIDGSSGGCQVALPPLPEPGIYRLLAQGTGMGGVIARNGLYLVAPPVEVTGVALDESTVVAAPGVQCTQGACRCVGECVLAFDLPPLPVGVENATVILELASFDELVRQTGAATTPTTVTVKGGGQTLCTLSLSEAPADERGVLSHLFAPKLQGTYGHVHECTLDVTAPTVAGPWQIELSASPNGVRVFGPLAGATLAGSRIVWQSL